MAEQNKRPPALPSREFPSSAHGGLEGEHGQVVAPGLSRGEVTKAGFSEEVTSELING